MAETRRVVVSLPSNLLDEANDMVPIEYENMSDFVMEAMKLFIAEKKKLEIIERLKNGYKEMSDLNLKLSEIGIEQDNIELTLYELNLRRCDLLWWLKGAISFTQI